MDPVQFENSVRLVEGVVVHRDLVVLFGENPSEKDVLQRRDLGGEHPRRHEMGSERRVSQIVQYGQTQGSP